MDLFQAAAYVHEIHFLRGHLVDKRWSGTLVFGVELRFMTKKQESIKL